MLSEAMEAAPVSPAGLGLGGNAPHSPTRLQTAVASAFAQPLASLDLAASSVCRPNENLNGVAKGLDRAAALEAKIGGEHVALALVGVGIGSAATVDWCAANMLQQIVDRAGAQNPPVPPFIKPQKMGDARPLRHRTPAQFFLVTHPPSRTCSALPKPQPTTPREMRSPKPRSARLSLLIWRRSPSPSRRGAC